MGEDRNHSVSILIPTRNRRECLREALDCLAAMDYPKERVEAVVIDDGSTDGIREMVARMQQERGQPLVYFRQTGNGIPAARNAGVRAARGDILIFTDDDCRFPKDWLVHLSRHFDTQNLGVVGVPDKNPAGGRFFSKCVDYTINSLVGSGGVRRKSGKRLARYYPRGFGMAVPRSVMEEVGPFDESLSAGEDIDLSYRIWKAGYVVKFDPEAFVWHERRNTLVGFLRQMFTRGYTRVELVRRHWGLMEPAYLLPFIMVIGFVILLGLSIFFDAALLILIFSASAYAVALVVSGMAGWRKIKDLRAIAVIPLLMMLQHLMYGLGTLMALVKRGNSKGSPSEKFRRNSSTF